MCLHIFHYHQKCLFTSTLNCFFCYLHCCLLVCVCVYYHSQRPWVEVPFWEPSVMPKKSLMMPTHTLGRSKCETIHDWALKCVFVCNEHWCYLLCVCVCTCSIEGALVDVVSVLQELERVLQVVRCSPCRARLSSRLLHQPQEVRWVKVFPRPHTPQSPAHAHTHTHNK